MKEDTRQLIKSFLLPAVITTLIVLGTCLNQNTLSSGYLPAGISNQQTTLPLKVSNRTNAFEVVNVRRDGQNARLTFRNNYKKAITAYALFVGGYQIKYELADEEVIVPGGAREQSLNLQAGQDRIIVLAVVFEDKAGDGDGAVIKEINDLRLGRRTQFSRIVPLLDKLLNTTDSQLVTALREVKIAINNLPNGPERESSHFFITGLRNAKEATLRDIEELDQVRQINGNAIFREVLVSIKGRFMKSMV
jgi:hypothetical protein